MTTTLAMLLALLAAGLPEAKVKARPQPAPEAEATQPPAAAAGSDPGLGDDQIREQVRTLLGTIDTPVSPARWKALGPRAAPFLEEIAASGNELPTRRAKALDGLSQAGGPTAQALLGKLARGEDEPLVVRLSAVRGLGRLTKGATLATALRPVLEGAKDARVRGLAAETLSSHAARQACAQVKAQAQREDDAARVHFEKALARCAPGAPAQEREQK